MRTVLNIYDSTRESRSQQHNEARRLAQFGLQVGPLEGKRPLGAVVPNGQYDFTTDLKMIDYWWSHFGLPNLGARPPQGYLVIDVDNRHGGLEKWEELTEGHSLPQTIVTETGSGGFHFWFRLPFVGELRGALAPGIDVRHDRNYLVMPTSVHPETGKTYEYRSWVDLPDVPVLPGYLRRHTYKPARPASPMIPVRLRQKGDGKHLIDAVLAAPAGSRNEALNTAAFLAGKNDFDIFDALAEAAEAVGLDPVEIERTLNSGKQAGKKEVLR